MSVSPLRRLPERPSLDQLRKQAKKHLDVLRAADPSATLATAQYGLARAYGFDSWPTLVHHVESLQPHRRMLQPDALKAGRMDIVLLLLDYGANPNLPEEQYAPQGKALYSAVYHGHYDIAKLLLDRGAPI